MGKQKPRIPVHWWDSSIPHMIIFTEACARSHAQTHSNCCTSCSVQVPFVVTKLFFCTFYNEIFCFHIKLLGCPLVTPRRRARTHTHARLRLLQNVNGYWKQSNTCRNFGFDALSDLPLTEECVSKGAGSGMILAPAAFRLACEVRDVLAALSLPLVNLFKALARHSPCGKG